MAENLGIFEEEGLPDAEPAAPVDPVAAEPVVLDEPKGEPAAPPAAEPEPPGHHVPIAVLLDERDKRKEALRQAEEATRRADDLARQIAAMQTPQKAPDFFENPTEALKRALIDERLNTSRFLAVEKYGEQMVKEAYDYFDQNPAQSQQLLNHPSPFHAAVEVYQRQKALSEIGPDPLAYRERVRQELLAEMQGQRPAPSSPKPPPLSLASAPSAGRSPNMPNINVPPQLTALFG